MKPLLWFGVVLGFWLSFQLGSLWTQNSAEKQPAPFPPADAAPVVVATAVAPTSNDQAADVSADGTPQTRPPTRPASQSAGDLVLGLAINQDSTKYVRRFIVSLRRFAPDATLVLCVDAATRTMLAKEEREFGVLFFVFDPSALPAPWATYHPSNYRYWVYGQWLATLGSEREVADAFGAAFVTDVRDTVFQADPFARIVRGPDARAERSSLHVFEEVAGRRIEDCGWNLGWVSDCSHGSLTARVRNELILCSGTTIGTWPAVLAYMRAMRVTIHASAFCERNGIDQGVHNVLLRTAAESIADVVVFHSHERGAVATLGMVDGAAVTRAWRDGLLYNAENEPYAVLHQVDRHKSLDAQLNKMYS